MVECERKRHVMDFGGPYSGRKPNDFECKTTHDYAMAEVGEFIHFGAVIYRNSSV